MDRIPAARIGRTVPGLSAGVAAGREAIAELREQLAERAPLPEPDVVHAAGETGRRAGREQVRADDVRDRREVPRAIRAAEQERRAARDELADPPRNDRRVQHVGPLPRTEDVEVAETDGGKAFGAGAAHGELLRGAFPLRIG